MPELTEADYPQLDRSERRTPPAADAAPARRLPGAARAQAFTEPAADTAPPPRELAVTAVTAVTAAAPVEPSAGSLWDRFEQPTGAATTDGPVAGWTPPAPTEAPAEWGRRPAVVKVLSFGLASAKPGREELDHRHNVRTIRAATWPRSARIAVANPKGGSGKTPTAVILGGILASIRGGSVAIWDAADAAGTLAGRTEGFAARCVSDIEA